MFSWFSFSASDTGVEYIVADSVRREEWRRRMGIEPTAHK